jgi:hypothetical protein
MWPLRYALLRRRLPKTTPLRQFRYLVPVKPPLENARLGGVADRWMATSTGQATSSTADNLNVQLIIGALADYAKETGVDLSKNPFAAKLKQSRSPHAILQLLEEREKAFKGYRDGKRRLINCLNPVLSLNHLLTLWRC